MDASLLFLRMSSVLVNERVGMARVVESACVSGRKGNVGEPTSCKLRMRSV